MTYTKLVVHWREGLHLRPAAALVSLARRFSSSIRLHAGERAADARSIMQVLLLSASLGTAMLVEADGQDEAEAVKALAELFADAAASGPEPGADSSGQAG
jgi:phosphocarrier protein HPr